MFDSRRYLRNILCNWGAFVTSIAIGFFLSPFLVRSLGDASYGYWSLVVTAVAYFGYFDLGIQSGVGHYVARHMADKDGGKLNDKINSALTVLLLVGLAVVVSCLGAAALFSRFFHVPADAVAPVRAAFLLMGLVTGMKFPFSVFQGLLVGAQRFDIVSAVSAGVKIANALCVVLAFRMGKGLVGLAVVAATTHLLEGIVLVFFARRAVPSLVFRPLHFRFPAFHELFLYGVFNFLLNVSAQFGAGFWAFILARKIDAAAVTYYSVGSEMLPYMAGIASAVTTPLLQAIVPMDVHADEASIRAMFLTGTRYLTALVFLVGLNLLLVGRDFLGQWMGEKFVADGPYGSSATVLALLTLANMAALSSAVAQQILFGRRKNKLFAGFIALESLCIAGLALALVPRYGMVGMAIATLVPMALWEGALVPLLAMRQAGAGLYEYLRHAILPNFLVTGLLYLSGRPLMRFAPHGGWAPIFACFTLVSVAYLIAAWFFLIAREHRVGLIAVGRRLAFGTAGAGTGG